MSGTMTIDALLPCPFCGGEASVVIIRDGRQVSCKGQPGAPCFAKGPAVFYGPAGWAACAAEAVAVWNRRAPDAATARRVEALEAAAKALLDGMASTYERNGRHVGIEADDGEKVWLVHDDLIHDLRAALEPKP